MHFSLILPCFNEEQNIEQTVADVLSFFRRERITGEVIVVDDGSTDGSAAILKKLAEEHSEVRIITHETNKGYGSAVRSGLDRAENEWIGFMDSDGQFHASDFIKLFPSMDQYDFITGRRLKRADPFMRRVNAKCFAILNVLVLHIWVRDINCAMKMWKRSLWQKIRPDFATGALFNAEMFYRMYLNDIHWKQVFVQHYPRQYGQQTGANLRVILRMFRDMWKLKRTGKR